MARRDGTNLHIDKIFYGSVKAQFSADPGDSIGGAGGFYDFDPRKSILRRRNGDFMG
jgi:hypothetical protein